MSYRRRGYVEVLDNLLTATVGGVAAEEHPYPPPGSAEGPYSHALEQPPVARLISVHGARNGQAHRFALGDDVSLAADGASLEWREGGAVPDPGSLITVNYLPEGATATVDDVQVGSVLRTISESVALEFGRLYAELEAVQDAGYIDSATGSELERVVALLGISRIPGGRPSGEVTFHRAKGSQGAIVVPAGTRIITDDGDVAYETTESVTLRDGQPRVRARSRDLEPGEALAAGMLTTLPVPISGIAAVGNEKPTAPADAEESDAELRDRAKRFLHGSERATMGALNAAIVSQGVKADIEDVMTDDSLEPGVVRISLHGEDISPEQEQRVRTAVADVRPAGVAIDWGADVSPVTLDLGLRLTTARGLVESQLRGIQAEIETGIVDYFDRLGVRSAASTAKLLTIALNVDGVEDARLTSATLADGSSVLDTEAGSIAIAGMPAVLGEVVISDPALTSAVDLVLSLPAGSGADTAAVGDALTASLDQLLALFNQRVEEEASEDDRTLRFGLLVHALELPGQPAGAVADAPDPLPTVADLGGASLSLAITDAQGRSGVLAADGDSYTLALGERLSLNQVDVVEASA